MQRQARQIQKKSPGHDPSRRLAIFLICVAITTSRSTAQTSTPDPLPVPAAAAQLKALSQAKASRSATEDKIDSDLLDAIRVSPNVATHSTAIINKNRQVLVDIKLDNTATADDTRSLASQLSTLGATSVLAFPASHSIHGMVPLARLEEIAASTHLLRISASRPPIQYASRDSFNSIDGEAIAAHSVRAAHAMGYDGTGVNVGIISDSIEDGYGNFERAQQTIVDGKPAIDPKKIAVITTGTGANAIVQSGFPAHEGYAAHAEGLAMAEIVHAVAPGADIYFATSSDGPDNMAANIRALAAPPYNCRIIVDDATYLDESPFQDGPIGLAINDIVASNKVLFFSSAANTGNIEQHTSGVWEGDFTASGLDWPGDGNPLNLFGGDLPYETFEDASRVQAISLFWDDPNDDSDNEYDLYVTDSHGYPFAHADNTTRGRRPSQTVYFSADQLPLPNDTRVYVVKADKAADRYLHLEALNGVFMRTGQTGGSVRGHNASPNAITVAAVAPPGGAFSPGQPVNVESYSADGPRRVFFHPDGKPITPGNFSSTGGIILDKPDVAAVDNVTTTLIKEGLDAFRGTSAAAPQVAAIAALLLQAQPTISLEQFRFALHAAAVQTEAPGVNYDDGFGMVVAPTLLALAGPRNLFVANYGNNSILELGSASIISGHGISRPGAIAFDNGKLFVANFGAGGVSVFDVHDSSATPLTRVDYPGLFNRDGNIAAGGGRLFILDGYRLHGIYVFDTNHGNAFLERLPLEPKYNGALTYATGKLYVSFDKDGPVAPCTSCPNRDGIGMFSATSSYRLPLNLTDSRLSHPYGLAVSGSKLYVANMGNNTVSVFDLSTNRYFATIADASLSQPRDLTVSAGKLFVSNFADNTISVFDTMQNNKFITKLSGGISAPQGLGSL